MEAFAFGYPVIFSYLDSIRFENEDENITNILYCGPENTDDLYEKIKLLLDDKEMRDQIGKHAKETILCKHQWTNGGNELKNIYDDILSN